MNNFVLPFTLFKSTIKGRLVFLGDAATQALELHSYPESICTLLLEALGLLAVIAGDTKTQSNVSLQVLGGSPVSLLLAGLSPAGQIRCCAKYKEPLSLEATLREYVGEKASMMVMMDGTETNYQAVVELKQDTLTQSILHFFHQSEQIPTCVKVFTDLKSKRLVSALMLQQLPSANMFEREDMIDQWASVLTFLETLHKEEALDLSLDGPTLLHRLFHEFGLKIYSPKPLEFGCTCSREKLFNTLKSFGDEELKELFEDHYIHGDCEFCGVRYSYLDSEFE